VFDIRGKVGRISDMRDSGRCGGSEASAAPPRGDAAPSGEQAESSAVECSPCLSELPAEWIDWLQAVRQQFVSLITVCLLFRERGIDTTFESVRDAVTQIAGAPFERASLRIISTIHRDFVQVSDACPRCGGEYGGGGEIIRLSFEEPEPCVRKRKQLVNTSNSQKQAKPERLGNPFKTQRPKKIKNVPAFIAKQTNLFGHLSARFAEVAVSSGGKTPPPLSDLAPPQPECAAEGATSAIGAIAPNGEEASTEAGEAPEPWTKGAAVSAANFCSYMMQQPEYRGEIVCARRRLGRKAHTVPFEGLHAEGITLAPSVVSSLRARGICALYSHQVAALSHLQRRRHVMVSTATSSGKSLVYTVPTVQAVLEDAHARILHLFPTKALAQDQLRGLEAFAEAACPYLLATTFDGDTASVDRKQLRKRAHVFLTNPDMLHTLLPKSSEWGQIFANLELVVVDEAHTYRGVFGSHVALLLRRLRRVCARLGASPTFICCSATIANPLEHMLSLTGLAADAVSLVDTDGAPAGARTLALWNPPPLKSSAAHEWHERLPPGAVTRRASPLAEAAKLLSVLIVHGVRTLAFVRTRSMAELLFLRTRELLGCMSPNLCERVAAYRAGYTVAERREIEQKLFGGELLAVVATSALELGVDVGHLDATLHVGFPGSMASLWQQAGRAGRTGRASLAVLVTQDNPLEQFFATEPETLLQRPVEPALLNARNAELLRMHLVAAAIEEPLRIPPRPPMRAQVGAEEDVKPTSTAPLKVEGKAAVGVDVTTEVDAMMIDDEIQPQLTVKRPVKSEGGAPPARRTRQTKTSSEAQETDKDVEPELGPWREWSGAAQAAIRLGQLKLRGDRLHCSDPSAAHAINLREMDRRRVRVVQLAGEGGLSGVGFGADELGSMEESAAQLRLYEGAVYLHAGNSFVVKELNLSRGVAMVRREDTAYFTEPRDHTRVEILGRSAQRPLDIPSGMIGFCGPMRVGKTVYGYRTKFKSNGQLLELVDLDAPLPPMEFETAGVWIEPPSSLRETLSEQGHDYARGGLHAIEHLLVALAPLQAAPFEISHLSAF